jgi:hypothetical protein
VYERLKRWEGKGLMMTWEARTGQRFDLWWFCLLLFGAWLWVAAMPCQQHV